MGGLTYGTYGAGTALVIIGLCTWKRKSMGGEMNKTLMRMGRHAVQWRGRSF